MQGTVSGVQNLPEIVGASTKVTRNSSVIVIETLRAMIPAIMQFFLPGEDK